MSSSRRNPLLTVAWRNVRLHWRHSLAAILSVGAGFVSLSVFQGYMAGVRKMYEETYAYRSMLGQMIVEKKGAQKPEGRADPLRYQLEPRDQAFLDAFLQSRAPQVRARARNLRIEGTVNNGRTHAIFLARGYDLAEGARLRHKLWEWNTIAGPPLEQQNAPDAAIIGKSLGAILDCFPTQKKRFINGIGGYTAVNRPFKCLNPRIQLDVTTQSGQLNSIDLQVGGILDAAFKDLDTRVIMLPLETAQKLADTRNVDFYAVELNDPGRVAAFLNDLRSEADRAGISLDAQRWQDHPAGDLYIRTMELLSIFRNFIVAVILAIAGLSVLNTLIKIVKERTREIGTLRSIGYRGNQIVGMFAVESILLATIGNVLGLGVALLLAAVINRLGILYKAGILTEPVPFIIELTPWICAESMLLLGTIAVIAAILPAAQTSRGQITENLVHV